MFDNNIGILEYTIADNGECVKITSWRSTKCIELTVEFEHSDDGRTITLNNDQAIALGHAIIEMASNKQPH